MEYILICSDAFVASGVTLFSGFGLGTVLLMPVFAVFFPVPAIVLTAIVHFLNNLFKLWPMRGIQLLVAILLSGIALGLASGLL